MGFVHGNGRGLLIEGKGLKVRLVLHVKAQGDNQIIVPRAQAAAQVLIGIALQIDLQLGIDGRHPLQPIREHPVDVLPLQHPDGEGCLPFPGQGTGLLKDLIQLIRQILQPVKQELAGLSQLDRAAGAGKQGKPQFLLHLGNLFGEVGLGGIQPPGRLRKAAAAGHLDKIADLHGVHTVIPHFGISDSIIA